MKPAFNKRCIRWLFPDVQLGRNDAYVDGVWEMEWLNVFDDQSPDGMGVSGCWARRGTNTPLKVW